MIRVTMRNGEVHTLAHSYQQVTQMVQDWNQQALVGSAAPPDIEVETTDGKTIRWADINLLEDLDNPEANAWSYGRVH